MASRGKKILVGIGIGCGGLLLLFAITVAVFFAWLGRPGELLEPGTLLGSDTTGYAEWTLRLEDPGTEEFVAEVLGRAQQPRGGGQSPLPPGLENILGGLQERQNRRQLQELFPAVAAWTLHPGETAGQDLQLLSVSLQSAGNRMVFADWMLSFSLGMANAPEARKIPYGDENIYQFQIPGGEPVTFFLRGNDLFFASNLATAQQAVDRLARPATHPSSPLENLFARAPEAPLRGALTNGGGEIFRVWERIAVRIEDPEELQKISQPLRGMVLSGRLTGEGTVEGRLGLLGPDAGWAAAHLEGALVALQVGLDLEPLRLEVEGAIDGEWMQIDYRLVGAMELWDGLIELPDEQGDSRDE